MVDNQAATKLRAVERFSVMMSKNFYNTYPYLSVESSFPPLLFTLTPYLVPITTINPSLSSPLRPDRQLPIIPARKITSYTNPLARSVPPILHPIYHLYTRSSFTLSTAALHSYPS